MKVDLRLEIFGSILVCTFGHVLAAANGASVWVHFCIVLAGWLYLSWAYFLKIPPP